MDAQDARPNATTRSNRAQHWLRWRGFRPGMALRVAIGFAAVALTVLTANFITQQSASEARHRVRQLVSEHEPLVRATEALAVAASNYERTVLDQAEAIAPDASHVAAAGLVLRQSAAAYASAAQEIPEHAAPQDFSRTLTQFEALGLEVIETGEARITRLREYWSRFDQLEAVLNAPQAKAARFAGAVLASERLLDLASRLSQLREQVSSAASVATPRSAQHIIERENRFRSLLGEHAQELSRLHGESWRREVAQRFERLVDARRALFNSIDDYLESSAMFRDEGGELSSVILTELVEPARRALADADRLAVRAADRADRQLVWASSAVLLLLAMIAFATVTSVTAPVRRLTDATRRLAHGALRTRVVRGGVRELDTLAAAFNQMAEQLQRAQGEVRAYQLELEAKVDERTRELNHLAHHDPLTDMPNRRQLFAHLEAAIARASAAGRRVAVLFIDLDHFKTINDSMGHAFGDRVLQAVSERLRLSSLFTRSFSARLGGDEFTIVCEDIATMADLERLSLCVLEEFQSSVTVHGRELRLSVSVGASVYPDHADDPHSLLRAADAALFRAKDLGRNCFSLYAPEMLEAASQRFKIEQALRRAVQRGEFELLYQPEVCFETLQTHTVEALLRWRQADERLISPVEFLAVAEQAGLITEISDWVLRTAVKAAAQWRRGVWPEARVAVNISSQQFIAGGFVERLEALLAEHELPPQALEIELTENVLQTGTTTIAALHRLRDLGVSIALDDFGVGYSSLTSLERLPLSRVKIDRTLIASVDEGVRSPAIVRSIIGLCHSLGLQVTAEGVERPTQLGCLLSDRGVHIQGFLIARPQPADRLPGFLAQAHTHLETLAAAAPTPAHHFESTTARLRTLRTPGGRRPRTPKAPMEER